MTATPVEAVEIVSADGAVLRGQRWSGNGTWAILLHEPGDDEDLDRWMPIAPHLAARGWTVLAVDLRGHGASDGEWDPGRAEQDIAAIVAFARSHESKFVALAAGGASAISALRIASETCPDALVLLSPAIAVDEPVSDLRGTGEAKLFVVGGGNTEARATAERLCKAAIGPVLLLNLPAVEQGTGLLRSGAATHLREHVIGFLAEQRFLAGLRKGRGGPADPPHDRDDPRERTVEG